MGDFLRLDKDTLKRKMMEDSCDMIQVPAKYAKKEVHPDIKAVYVKEDQKLAPYLCCDRCKALILWFKVDENAKATNVSGIKDATKHVTSMCPNREHKGQMNIKSMLVAKAKPSDRSALNNEEYKQWKKFCVEQLADHPTVSIRAHAEIMSNAANYAASKVFGKNKLSNFEIGRTALRDQIAADGKNSANKLLKIFDIAANRNDFGVSCMLDYWTARHGTLTCYGGVVASLLTPDFEWVTFPLRLDELSSEVAKDAPFTFDFLMGTIGAFSGQFAHPFFLCTDNEPKMLAAFDGRYECENFKFGG